MPDFQRVSQQFASRVEFLGINMQEVSLDSALVVVTGVESPLAHDLSGSTFQMFGGVAMPTTVFITASSDVARAMPDPLRRGPGKNYRNGIVGGLTRHSASV